MSYYIFADVSIDIDKDYAAEHDIHYVPMEYVLGEDTFHCEAPESDSMMHEYYEKLRNKIATHTSQITPNHYIEVFEEYVKEGKVFGRKDIGGIVGQMEPYIEVVAAETIRNSVDELHDILDRTFDDLTAGKNVFHDDFADLIQHADKAVDTGHIMADEVSSFANSNMDQMNLIVERMEYVSDSLPAVLESFSQSMNSMNSMLD